MTDQQWQTVERSISGLSALDKLELVERLVHELRSSATADRQMPAGKSQPLTEAEFLQQLVQDGLMTSLPTPTDPASWPDFEPVKIEGEPLSETIIRERR